MLKERQRGDRIIFFSGPGITAYAVTAGGLALAVAGALALLGAVDMEESGWIPFCFGLLLAFGGLFLFRWEVVAFDTTGRRIVWSKRSLVSQRKGELPFAAVERVLTEAGKTETAIPTARVLLKAGSESLPLTIYHSRSRAEWLPVARRIEQILGLAQSSLEDELRAMKQQGQVIDAVKLLRVERGLGLAEAKDLVDRL